MRSIRWQLSRLVWRNFPFLYENAVGADDSVRPAKRVSKTRKPTAKSKLPLGGQSRPPLRTCFEAARADVLNRPLRTRFEAVRGTKTKWVTHATNQKLRGDAGLRYPH